MGRFIGGVGLASVAIAMAVAGWVSIYTPLLTTWSLSDRHAVALSFFDGRVRLFYFQSAVEAIEVGPIHARFPPGQNPKLPLLGSPILPRIRVGRLPLPYVVPVNSNGRNPFQQEGLPYDVRLGDRRAVPDFGGAWRGNLSFGFFPFLNRPPAGEVSYFRIPVWLPVALLILFPVRAMIVGPWRERRRRKRNQCIGCGYHLYGLTEPRCPECGASCEIATAGQAAIPK